jgi:hypothetical protein
MNGSSNLFCRPKAKLVRLDKVGGATMSEILYEPKTRRVPLENVNSETTGLLLMSARSDGNVLAEKKVADRLVAQIGVR